MMNLSKDFQVICKLGEGAYGCVYKARMVMTDAIVAVKTIRMNVDDDGISSTTLREITILKNLNHPNIIKLLDFKVECESANPKVDLIFDFMDEDLSKRLRTVRKFDQVTMKKVMRQLLQGVQYMHNKKVFHRDLKPQNVLINHQGVVKIADFGLGRIVGHKLSTMSKEIQTLWYRAPQLLFGTVRYDFAVDIWSIGCIFYEIAEGSVLFQTESQIGQIFEIMKQCGTPKKSQWEQIVGLSNFKPTFPKFKKTQRKYKNLDPYGVDLLESMTILNPKNRINVSAALNHPYFCE